MRNFFVISCLFSCLAANATDVSESTLKNNWGGDLVISPFGLGLDLQTKYIWRGMEMMSLESAPVLFPSINFSANGLFAYIMGGYAINGEYAEVDCGVSYTVGDFTVGVSDYFYPSIDKNVDKYSHVGKGSGHWMEACVNYAPVNIPIWSTLSNFFYGADRYLDENGSEKQAYSTYVELGTYYNFIENNKISLAVGAALNKSCYNGYSRGFSICNTELKYAKSVKVSDAWSLPVSVSYIYNPVYDKSFVNFTANFVF